MNEAELFAIPEINQLSNEKKEFMKTIINSSKNINKDNSLAFIVKINAMIKESKIDFTPKEKELIISVLTSSMSEAERKKFELIKGIIGKNFNK